MPIFLHHHEIGVRFIGLALSYEHQVTVRVRCIGCHGLKASKRRFISVGRLKGEVIPAHALLDIRVTRAGTVGRYIQLIKAGSVGATIASELCLAVGSSHPSACPSPTTASNTSPVQPTVTSSPLTPTVSTPSKYLTEQVGSLGAPTFLNPHAATGEGPRIGALTTVEVSCKTYAPEIPSANPDGYWYRIHSEPWRDLYYAVANTFENGDVPGQSTPPHNTDLNVPDC